MLFVCSLLLLSGCSHMANDSWSGQDKAQHFIASAMLSAAGNEYAQHQGMSRDRSATFGLMFSVGLGASKELWDSRPRGAAGAGKILPGMSPVQLPAIPSGNWRITKDASLFLYGAMLVKPETPPRPSRSHTRRRLFPFLLISATTLHTLLSHQI